MSTAEAFEDALLAAGYAPSTAHGARAAAKGLGPQWAKALYAEWQSTGEVPQRRSARARLALLLVGKGLEVGHAHRVAKEYTAWLDAGSRDADRNEAVCKAQAALPQADLFHAGEQQEFNRQIARLGLSQRQAAKILGVSRAAIANWLAGNPIAPSWACEQLAVRTCEQLAVKTVENRPSEANKPEQGEE